MYKRQIYTLRFDNTFIVVAMMVTRVISYYLCMALSGVVTLVYHIRLMKRKRQEIPREKSEMCIRDRCIRIPL